jgi:hypothetical protein
MVTIAIILMVLYFIEQVVCPYAIALGYRIQADIEYAAKQRKDLSLNDQ